MITKDNKKFITTPAITTDALCQTGLAKNARCTLLSFILEKSLTLPIFPPPASSSPYNLTNPPMGNKFNEYIVSPIFLPNTLGGNPNPNSSTLIPNFFATKKCPASWMRTRTERIRRKTRIVTNIFYLSYKKEMQMTMAVSCHCDPPIESGEKQSHGLQRLYFEKFLFFLFT